METACIAGPLWGESTGQRRIVLTKDQQYVGVFLLNIEEIVELLVFSDTITPAITILWRHCNELGEQVGFVVTCVHNTATLCRIPQDQLKLITCLPSTLLVQVFTRGVDR